MDRRFVVRTKLDPAGCRAFWWIVQGKIFVLSIGMAVLCGILFGIDRSPLYLALLGVLVLLLILVAMQPRRMYKNATANGSTETESIFTDDKVYVRGTHSESSMDYAGFVKFIETDRYYFLFIQKRSACILPKKDFVEGDPEDFCEFLIDKNVRAA